MKPQPKKEKQHIVEYRDYRDGPLNIKNIKENTVDAAMKVADDLKNKGKHDVSIRII